MSSESKAQQGIQQTVKHFKAFFISEKPIFLSKILIFYLIICVANWVHGFRYILSIRHWRLDKVYAHSFSFAL
jgi:hypothetical protein